MRFDKIKYFILFFLIIPLTTFGNDKKPVQFYLFTSEDCEQCNEFKEFYLPMLQEDYDIEYKEFDIMKNGNMDLLVKMEKAFGEEGNEVPVIFIDDTIISGDEVYTELETVIQKHSDTGLTYPKLETVEISKDTSRTTAEKKPIYIAYFYKVGCKLCDRTAYDLKGLQEKYPQVKVKKYDVTNTDAMQLNQALCKLSNVPEKYHHGTPMIFIGDDYLFDEDAVYSKIEQKIEKYKDIGTQHPEKKAEPLMKESQNEIIQRFKEFGILTIILAGLIDGINPCAFATIIFFISYLTLLGRKGKEVLFIGGAYTLAVFITYFTIGVLGLRALDFLTQLKFLSLVVDIIFLVTGVIVIIFGIYSIKDYILYKKGNVSDMSLQLPKSIKRKIHKIIREKSRASHFVISAFAIGFLVSLQELFCTGQVYLPTLIYMSQISGYKTVAFLYLVLYNLLFIIPLVIVFLLVYWGVTSERIGDWMKDHLGIMKISMAIIFFALGIILIGNVIL